jgi:peptide-methionine (S)-S-oxide reductase
VRGDGVRGIAGRPVGDLRLHRRHQAEPDVRRGVGGWHRARGVGRDHLRPEEDLVLRALDLFWHNTDPTQSNGQFCDIGNQYRSEIFYTTPGQKQLAEESKRKLETTPQRFKGKIVTPIVAATKFYPAEEYHQDFYRKDPERYQSYREGCGRDRRLTQLWGKPGRQGHAEAESAAAH